MRSRWLTVCCLAIVGIVAAIASASSTSAHAVLLRSDPEADAQLQQAPGTITLWFTEPLERSFSHFDLYDGASNQINIGNVIFDSSDPNKMAATLPELGPGVYTVIWQTLSLADQHTWYGSFAFTVLNPDGSVPEGPAAGVIPTVQGGTLGPTPLEVVARWLVYLSAAVIVGGLAVSLLVLPGAVAQVSSSARGPLAQAALGNYVRLAIGATGVLLAAGVGQVILQADRLGSLANIDNVVFDTRFGDYWLWRQGLALLVGALLLGLGRAGQSLEQRHTRAMLGLALALGGGALFTISQVSHASAVTPGSFWAAAADFVHLAAASLWIGGLVLLPLFLFRAASLLDRQQHIRLLTHSAVRFSSFAALSVFFLLATGVFSGLVQVPRWEQLVTTSYGRTLLIKLGLITPLLGIALVNNTIVRRWLNQQDSEPMRRFLPRLMALESVLGVAVLISVAVLVQMPSPRTTDVEAARQASGPPLTPYVEAKVDLDLGMHLTVDPPKVGRSRFLVHLYTPGSSDSDVGQVNLVRLRFNAPGTSGGGATADAADIGNNTYQAEGGFLSLPGDWGVEVTVRRQGQDDVVANFTVPVQAAAASPTGSSFANPISQLNDELLVGLALLLVGLVPVLWRREVRALAPRLSAWMLTGGFTTLFASAILIGQGIDQHLHTTPASYENLTNPFANDPASIERGRSLFGSNCARCHGPTGLGNGPDAVGLIPPPANLNVHVPAHSDNDIFFFISEGIRGTAMPPFKDTLSEEERWDLVNFLRATFDAPELRLQPNRLTEGNPVPSPSGTPVTINTPSEVQ